MKSRSPSVPIPGERIWLSAALFARFRRFLTAVHNKYHAAIVANYERLFLPNMTPDERRLLAGVVVEVPLRGESGSLFDFRSYPLKQPPRVVMPALSIRFFADLAVAFAWLHWNGYVPNTVVEYVELLKYGDARTLRGRLPAPHVALRIPANADDDPRVSTLANLIVNDAILFTLAHELGHVLHRHPGYDSLPREAARANEVAADSFALEMLRRVGEQPTGMMYLFLVVAHGQRHRGDFSSEEEYEASLRSTHPLTSNRVRLIAEGMRTHARDLGRHQDDPEQAANTIRTMSAEMVRVAEYLDNPEAQHLSALTTRNQTFAGLAPRRANARLEAWERSSTQPGTAFDGVYNGELDSGNGPVSVQMLLRRNGDRVAGTYSTSSVLVLINGHVDGNTLTYEWETTDASGRGRMTLSPGNQEIRGTWGSGEAAAGGGTLRAARR